MAFGEQVNLTIAKTYLSSLLANAKVVRYLAQHHNEIVTQFQKLTEMTSLTLKNSAGKAEAA